MRILIADEWPVDAYWTSVELLALSGRGTVDVDICDRERAPAVLESERVDVVLFDPGRPRTRAASRVRSLVAAAGDAPVVVWTQRPDARTVRRFVRAGAQDCLAKGEATLPALLERVDLAVERHARLRTLERARDRAEHDAARDSLTGLATRAILTHRVGHAVAEASRSGRRVGVMFVDLDDFKGINDRVGHAAADAVLRGVGRRLSRSVRATDTVARTGGDEFVVLAVGLEDVDGARRLGESLVHALERPHRVAGAPLEATASVGVAVYPDHASDAACLVRKADEAMYLAKHDGRGRCVTLPVDLAEPAAATTGAWRRRRRRGVAAGAVATSTPGT